MTEAAVRACPHARPAFGLASLCVAIAMIAALPAAAQTDAIVPSAPKWDHDLELNAEAGYAQLRWNAPDEEIDADWIYELEEGERPEFADTDRHYEGHSTSSFVSGLTDGTVYYRVRARHPDEDTWSDWSETVTVEVSHHSRSLALSLMSIGGLVFLATAFFLIAHRNDPIEVAQDGGAR